MKIKNFLISLLAILNGIYFAFGQTISSHVMIATVYSQNEKFYLKTIP